MGIFWSRCSVMQKSEFFHGLASMYEAEMDDLLSDSDGRNVLAKRLQTKREQLSELLPMMDFAPEMVAPVFFEAFSFSAPADMDAVVGSEPDDGDFPGWDALASSITVAAWAQAIVDRVRAEPGGGTFLVVAAALEYLRLHEARRSGAAAAPATDPAPRPRRADDDDGDDDGDDRDLAESGSGWMTEQGFDALDA